MNNYKSKYNKYKQKYLKLKTKLKGGSSEANYGINQLGNDMFNVLHNSPAPQDVNDDQLNVFQLINRKFGYDIVTNICRKIAENTANNRVSLNNTELNILKQIKEILINNTNIEEWQVPFRQRILENFNLLDSLHS